MSKYKQALEEHVILEGDPSFGVVTWLKQIHGTQQYLAHDLAHLGRFQAAILERLLELNPTDIFYEPLTENILCGSADRTEQIRDWALKIRREYPEKESALKNVDPRTLVAIEGNSLNQLSKDQLVYLGLMEATFTYALLNSDVNLRRTCSAEEFCQFADVLQASDFYDPAKLLAMSADREKWLGREISDFLKQSPESRCVLVYGVAHQLDGDPNRLPCFVSNEWPSLREEHNLRNTFSIQNILLHNPQNSQVQLVVVKFASVLFYGSFGAITSAEAQLVALPKLVFDSATKPEKGELVSYLKSCAKSPKVLTEIDQMIRKKKGVFGSFH